MFGRTVNSFFRGGVDPDHDGDVVDPEGGCPST
jgi:hypothetical protein